jgi:hypothetical protein
MRKHGRSFLMMVTNLSSATTGVCASRKSLGTCDRSRLSKRLPTLELRVLEENDCFAIPNFSAIHHFPSLIQAELYHFDFFTFRRGSAAIGRSMRSSIESRLFIAGLELGGGTELFK